MDLFQEIDLALFDGCAFVNCCAVEDRTSYHAHNFIEIAYVAAGRGTQLVGQELFSVEKGNITIVNYDIPHQFVASEPLTVYNCIFTPGYLDRMLAHSRDFFDLDHHYLLGDFYRKDFQRWVNVMAGPGEEPHIQYLFERMLLEYQQRQVGSRELLRSHLIELLVLIFRLNLRDRPATENRLLPVLDHLHSHFAQPLRVGDLARMANLSGTHFCRLFRQYTGTTPVAYLQKLRVEEACRLLSLGEKNVQEVAAQVGYQDMKHFYQVFRRVTGKLPGDFR